MTGRVGGKIELLRSYAQLASLLKVACKVINNSDKIDFCLGGGSVINDLKGTTRGLSGVFLPLVHSPESTVIST